ncbi:MAG: BsuBI/PstI family type II restriction endonuclease [bacterium]
MVVDEVKALLHSLNFSPRHITDQTAFCILALADTTPRQGLLAGHISLSDGARIHDILNFVRMDFDRTVAENTRESYRKTSLRPLINAGWVIRYQLSTNDPNTYYRLHPKFARLLALTSGPERDPLIEDLSVRERKVPKQRMNLRQDVIVAVMPGQTHALSPGHHNLLEKAIVETLGPALLQRPQVVYLGDTAPRFGYQNRALMRSLNLPIDISVSLPDVILYGSEERSLLVVEAVVSTGPVTQERLDQLMEFTNGPAKLGVKIIFISAFPSRKVFRQYAEDIAWGSSVWIENEPYNIIQFIALPPVK